MGVPRLLLWAGLGAVALIALVFAARSPLLSYREAPYITAGFAGIVALILLLFQPLLAARITPGLSSTRALVLHRGVALVLVAAVLVHVGALWITSPPDVVDALTFASPTAFSVWGVIAMWLMFAAALMGALRRRLPLAPRIWRLVHLMLVAGVVTGAVVHALLIVGTMETNSKVAVCIAAVLCLAIAMRKLLPRRKIPRR